MKTCNKCRIKVLDDTNTCPLCNQVLEGDEKGHDMYPNIMAGVRWIRFFENIFLFLSVVCGMVLGCLSIMKMLSPVVFVIVGLILLYLNAIIRVAVTGQSGYMLKLFSLYLLAAAVLIAIDGITGYKKWSLDYVIPGGIMTLDGAIVALMLINHKNWQSYIPYQITVMLMSFVLLILIWTKVIDDPVVAVIAFLVTVSLFLGTVIIGDSTAREELKRRFYF